MSRPSVNRGLSDTLLVAVLVTATVVALAMGLASDARGELIGDYDLTTGTLNNSLSGGSALGPLFPVANSFSTGFNSNGWSWTAPTASPGSGLTAVGLPANDATTFGNYTIGLRFFLGQVDGYRKIIDYFKGVDQGQYVHTNAFRFYIDGVTFPTGGSIAVDSFVDFVLTRDASTKLVNAYVNGSLAPVISFTDSGNHAQTATSRTLQFFVDDGGAEYSASGTVSLIRIWDEPLSPAEIPTAMVPEPSTAVLLAFAGTGIGLLSNLLGRRCRAP